MAHALAAARQAVHEGPFDDRETAAHASRLAMWMFVASELMFFAALFGLYAAARRQADPTFDTGGFAAAYAILAAQRATKILGIFARLDKRDGKPDYLRHLPRIQAYLARNLAHPALARLKGWYAAFGGFAGPSA